MRKLLLILILPVGLLAGCISSPLQGWLVTYTANHSPQLDKGSISSASITKKGESCSWGSYLWNAFYYGGGGNVKEAADSAGIKKVAVVDRRSFSMLFHFVYRECVLVYGE